MQKKFPTLIFLVAFIEGGAVMCVELCSAKILAPYFGTSIYVWAAVLGITLTALTSGYYFGGYLSSKTNNQKQVAWLMLLGGLLLTLTPTISNFILPITIKFSLLSGTIISLMSFLFFSLVCFGAVSPMLINWLTSEAKESGKNSGTIYAVSTLGGIFSTFLVGFYLLPNYGITKTLYGYGLLVVIISLVLFFRIKKTDIKVLIIAVFALISYNFSSSKTVGAIVESDGILGNIKIMDRKYPNGKVYREMMVNNISQTIMNMENPNESLWGYVGVLMYNINNYSNEKKALLLGMGGGTVYKQLINNGYEVDIVEIDSRIEKLAKKYFFIDNEVEVIIDDARHFIRTTNKKYDVIIYDLYHSETPPVHLMTKEAFENIKEKLNKNGMLVVNFYGFTNGSKGRAARSLYKTLKHTNFDIHLIATDGEENQRNLLFMCGKSELKAKQQIIHNMIYEMDLNFDDALLLTDDKPVLEHIYLEAALQWRKDYNEVNAKQFLR